MEEISNLKEELLEVYRRINKLEIQLEVTNKENAYMKSNIKTLKKELKKIKKSKTYKILKILRKIKKKLVFWRKK